MESKDCSEGFCGIGQWEGLAEVYDGQGHFLGNGVDQRHVRTQTEDGRTRIDLAFVGPLKFSGHYFIENKGDHRLYQGPVNCGYAEALGRDCVAAHGYWPVTGLSQRFFLMMAPDGQRQFSLALMARGEQLLYVVVGENVRVQAGQVHELLPMVNGGCYDLQYDPKAGRTSLYLHREGYWEGDMSVRMAGSAGPSVHATRQVIERRDDRLSFTWGGSPFLKGDVQASLSSNDWQAWSGQGDFVGSYSLYGGRALSGHFHDLPGERRVWRREVASADGQFKAVVNSWYEGERPLGSEWGLLRFRSSQL